MLGSSEYSMLLKNRANVDTHMLEHRRVSLETAIEALQVVGHKVFTGNDGTYSVLPPSDHQSKYGALHIAETASAAEGSSWRTIQQCSRPRTSPI